MKIVNMDTQQSGHGLPVLRELVGPPWVGIAVAANFLKDSQISGLRARGMNF